MDRARYARVKETFRAAIRWPPADRAAVIDALAADDAAVRDEARSLLAHHREAAGTHEAAGPDEIVAPRAGPTLAETAAGAGWSIERVVRTLDPIAAALTAAATGGGCHGAVDARHVLVEESGGAPVATLRGAGAEPSEIALTTASAPEQLSSRLGPIGPWTDVYALALLCVELLRGRPVSPGPVEALARARDDAPPPSPHALGLDVPAAVDAVLAMAMAARPMDRYPDVRRFWTALRDSVATAGPPPPAIIVPARRRRARVVSIAIAAAVAAAAAIALIDRCT